MAADWKQELRQLTGAYAHGTLRGYRFDMEIFEAWCASRGRPSLPAAPETVVEFLNDQRERHAIATIHRRLQALRRIHGIMGETDPTQSEAVTLAFRTIRRAKTARQRQAKGLTEEHLARFLAVQPDSLIGKRNRAMLALGYELLARRSELLALRVDDLTLRGDGTFRVLIRKSKVDPYGTGRTAFTSRRTAELVQAWLDDRRVESPHLFTPVWKGIAKDRPVTDNVIRRIITESARMAEFPPEVVRQFSGHSLRVGAAQDLLRKGFDGIAIMRAGGWKTYSMVARYIEEAEQNLWES